MQISLIWAMAENRVIGRDNTLPWRLPDDLKHFMRVTMGKPVIMGRKTFESMKAPLPGRTNIVITRDRQWQHPGVEVAHEFEQALDLACARAEADGQTEVMVIGGAEIYALALPRADRLYVTHVHAEPAGDVFFPPVDLSAWRLVTSQRHEADDRHSAAYTIALYERA